MVMRPDDLVEFSRHTYARTQNVASWGSEELISCGLYPQEEKLLEQIPFKNGKLLLLGVGGGREAIPLAQSGFQVTGLDFVPEMVELAKKNASKFGIKLDGLVQEISDLNLPPKNFTVVWLSAAMYSCVPTRDRRISMLKRIHHILADEGLLAIQFSFIDKSLIQTPRSRLYKAIAWMTLGNLSYEPGDTLRHKIEFMHDFSDQNVLREEFTLGGFTIQYFEIFKQILVGGAILKPSVNKSNQV
jgi:ubiquinone/menaquinone biosynthesis C-methylase UbiE